MANQRSLHRAILSERNTRTISAAGDAATIRLEIAQTMVGSGLPPNWRYSWATWRSHRPASSLKDLQDGVRTQAPSTNPIR